MTAFNIIAQPGAAYIINDTAAYDDNLVIRRFGGKTITLTHAIVEPAALASCGCVLAEEYLPILGKMNLTSGTELVRRLPDLLEEGRRIARLKGRCAEDGIWLGVATYSFITSRAAGYTIAADEGHGGIGAGYVPGTVVGGSLGSYTTSGDLSAAFGKRINLADPQQFDPIMDATHLLQAQRERTDERFPIVGGQGVVTRVSAAGVQTFVVCEWPDRIDERIDVAAPPETLVHSLSGA